ncbi:MAG: PHB depolymerase family esterase [Candidatus Caenarcaniphilales bacterium]|nr:PHB depolymerase family esterase [Candidatus Caenarcaniphilales bacterium]
MFSFQSEVLDGIFLPAKDQNSKKLMLVMHGLGDSALGYTWLLKELQIPELSYWLVNAPTRYYEGYSWYDIEGEQGMGIKASRDLLVQALSELNHGGWSAQDIILFGFSQGCVMAYTLGLTYPEVFAGICGVSGYIYWGQDFHLSPVAADQNWLITHGTEDQVIPPQLAKSSQKLLDEFGVPLQIEYFDKGHTIDFEREFPRLKSWIEERLSCESNRCLSNLDK